jgi:hypothetical protein
MRHASSNAWPSREATIAYDIEEFSIYSLTFISATQFVIGDSSVGAVSSDVNRSLDAASLAV